MLLNGKRFADIDEDHLARLIGYEENSTIDFKQTPYLPSPKATTQLEKDKWKRDLCTDVTALANAQGGWIICGIRDKDGIAEELCGCGQIIPDDEILRLEQSIISQIDPRIPGVKLREISLTKSGNGHAILIYVPQSLAGPHRVKLTDKFHFRGSKGNIEMDVSQLRMAFGLSLSYIDRIRDFRKKRVDALGDDRDGILPASVKQGIRLAIHLVPLASTGSSYVDLSAFNSTYPAPWLMTSAMSHYLSHGHYNFDGYIVWTPTSEGVNFYVQIFRTGAIEFVEVDHATKDNFVDLVDVERYCLKYVQEGLHLLKNLGVNPPIGVMLSIAGENLPQYRFAIRQHGFYDTKHGSLPIGLRQLFFPELIVEDYIEDLYAAMKPTFDIMWNSGGWERSYSYDKSGKWTRT